MRILIVEDDLSLQAELVKLLESEGYVVDTASDGEEGLHFAQEYPLDLAIVDLGLPEISGMDLIREVRKDKAFPILILTARDRWQEKVEGLEAGADDYVVKPFQGDELMARLRALLRRSVGVSTSKFSSGPLTLNPATKEVRISEESVSLTAYEYRVLEFLMMNLGRVVSKGELMEHVYPDESDRDSNVLEVFVRRLRKKLDPKENLQPIETLRGQGYRLRELPGN